MRLGNACTMADYVSKSLLTIIRFCWYFYLFLIISFYASSLSYLSRYLNRTARHPKLREDQDFKEFLEAETVRSIPPTLHVCWCSIWQSVLCHVKI